MLALVFVAWMVLRMVGTLVQWPEAAAPARLRDHELPIYTVMVALYREAAAAKGLAAALSKLNYPAEKLDIKFIVEADDPETQAALNGVKSLLQLRNHRRAWQGPRTKPKALNVALPLARGTLPSSMTPRTGPSRISSAARSMRFSPTDERLACVQACLTIDNTADNWLTGSSRPNMPASSMSSCRRSRHLRLPLPLGGSSNHFRTARLREVGAWDPYNVTEDADLGMRLARFGYRVERDPVVDLRRGAGPLQAVAPPAHALVQGLDADLAGAYARAAPAVGELGLPAFFAFQLMVGGNVLASLVHPIFLIWFIGAVLGAGVDNSMTTVFGFAVLFGYAASALLAGVGLARRRLLAHASVLLLMPVHWLLLSLAAWRALYQLVREPYRWEKTEHGLARTSRIALAGHDARPYPLNGAGVVQW